MESQPTPLQTRTGRLQVNVYASDQGQPLNNATVRITPRDNPTTIEELTSDSSGQTPVIDLDAPPLEFSLTPSSPVQPYSEYDIYATVQGLQPIIVQGTQILPDVIALQNITMQPLPPNRQQPRDIYIAPHTLWGSFPPKIPEEEVKPLPPGTGLTVLPQPVVPEFVVVHLGAPSDTSASNVWIPFQD